MSSKAHFKKDDVSVLKAVDYINRHYIYGELVKHSTLKKLSGLHDDVDKDTIPLSVDERIPFKVLVEKQLTERQKMYQSFIRHVRKIMLEEHKKELKNDFGKGYVILLPQEQASYAKDNLVSSVLGAINKNSKIMSYTNTDKLSAMQLRTHNDKSTIFNRACRLLNKAIHKLSHGFSEADEFEKPTDTMDKTSSVLNKLKSKEAN